MGIFSRARTFAEPVLGTWSRRSGWWWAAYELPGHVEVVEVGVPGSRTEPEPVAVQHAIELQARYEELIEPIQRALYSHYEPYRESFEAGALQVDDVPLIVAACDVWPHVTLERVRIEMRDRQAEVEVAYATAWDYDNLLGARVRNWHLIELRGGA